MTWGSTEAGSGAEGQFDVQEKADTSKTVEKREKADTVFDSLFVEDYPSNKYNDLEKPENGEGATFDETALKGIIEKVFDSLFSDDFIKALTDNRSENSGEPSDDESKTRELTEEEKVDVQDKTGWSDEQMKKCTIDENGVIHYKCDRDDLSGKVHETAGILYERRIVVINGVKVEVVVPKFNSKFDCRLPDNLLKVSNRKQFENCNNQLGEAIKNDPELRSQFTDEQIEDILNGDTPEGYIWHHDAESGKMQLVDEKEHDRTQGGAAHTGGKALWGGGY